MTDNEIEQFQKAVATLDDGLTTNPQASQSGGTMEAFAQTGVRRASAAVADANRELEILAAATEAVRIAQVQRGETHATLMSEWAKGEIARILRKARDEDGIQPSAPYMAQAFGSGFAAGDAAQRNDKP